MKQEAEIINQEAASENAYFNSIKNEILKVLGLSRKMCIWHTVKYTERCVRTHLKPYNIILT